MSRTAARGSATASEAEQGEGIELFRRMVLVRRFEDTVQELFQRGEVHGTTHLYSPPLEDAFLPGAEAIASSVRERL